MEKGKLLQAYLFLAFTLFAFSSIEVLSKPLMGKVDPFFMTAFRFFVGGLILTLFVKEEVSIRDLLGISLVGMLNSMVSMTALQLSVKYSNASTAATLVASNPIFVSLFAALLLKERYKFRKYVGIALGFVGLLVFSLGKISGDSWLGIFFGLLAALTFGLYTVLMKRYTKRYTPLTVTAYSSLISSVLYFIVIFLLGKLSIPTLDTRGWMLMIYFGVIVTGIAYVTYFKAMQYVGATQSSRIFFLKPVVATLLAILLLGEVLSLRKLVGMVIILISLTL
ncbi:DMT family transporter [Fervidobacterium thailandense]|uniref:EamA domain-containing protein n=1 Tax=Fervidobacterium thailandense TaxID=1008305 RepID=A0A1E3G4E8_9BACT|nr:EamA family transporter [Fervidobacterium thailandense]ODN31145.1 hypothetical protein A4H02_02460 [Fervidobacterium thailandense]